MLILSGLLALSCKHIKQAGGVNIWNPADSKNCEILAVFNSKSEKVLQNLQGVDICTLHFQICLFR